MLIPVNTVFGCSLASDSTSHLPPSPCGAELSDLCISLHCYFLKNSPKTNVFIKHLKNSVPHPVLISSSTAFTLLQPCKWMLRLVYKTPQKMLEVGPCQTLT